MQYFVCSNLSCVEANRGIHGHLPNQSNDSYVNVCVRTGRLSALAYSRLTVRHGHHHVMEEEKNGLLLCCVPVR